MSPDLHCSSRRWLRRPALVVVVVVTAAAAVVVVVVRMMHGAHTREEACFKSFIVKIRQRRGSRETFCTLRANLMSCYHSLATPSPPEVPSPCWRPRNPLLYLEHLSHCDCGRWLRWRRWLRARAPNKLCYSSRNQKSRQASSPQGR